VEQYVNAHGGGTIAVSSQTGAEAAIVSSGAKVAGIGGFSGRESEVSVQWLAQAVRSGQIRWVLVPGGPSGGGFRGDTRAGSSKVMAAVAQVGRAVPSSAYGSSTSGSSGTLYDLAGQADALLAAG
jgi:hypothetical protein